MVQWHVQTFASVQSTQDLVKHHISESGDEGIVIQALEQKGGRGRVGRVWESPMGNLYMSVLLRPECKADKAGQLSFVVAIALSRAVDKVIDDGFEKRLKWPNDILINDKKLAGILLESDLNNGNVEAVAVGIGVNILMAPLEAISVRDIAGDRQIAIHPFRDMVLEELAACYQIWKNEGFEPIRQEWLKQAYRIGEKTSVTIGDKKVEGILSDLDENGQLILIDDSDDKIAVNSGDLYFS